MCIRDSSIGANMGFVKNKVTKFQGDVSSISGVYKIQEGKPINQLYVITVDRIVRDQADLCLLYTSLTTMLRFPFSASRSIPLRRNALEKAVSKRENENGL